jgi:hypothetical protein
MLEIAGGILIAVAVIALWPLLLLAAVGVALVGLVVVAYAQWGGGGLLLIAGVSALSLAVSEYQRRHGLH